MSWSSYTQYKIVTNNHYLSTIRLSTLESNQFVWATKHDNLKTSKQYIFFILWHFILLLKAAAVSLTRANDNWMSAGELRTLTELQRPGLDSVYMCYRLLAEFKITLCSWKPTFKASEAI